MSVKRGHLKNYLRVPLSGVERWKLTTKACFDFAQHDILKGMVIFEMASSRVLAAVLFWLIGLIPATGTAQNIPYTKEHGDTLIKEKFTVNSQQEARSAVENIVKYTGITQNFEIVENPNIPTAIAYIRNKKRYIAYNPAFMVRVKVGTQSDWGAISVLAHEIGHHLSGHTLIRRRRDPQEELDADRFSGFILYKMGATLDQAKSCISNVELNSNPLTHPAKNARLIAITMGWLDANKLDEGAFAIDTSAANLFPVMPLDSVRKKKSPYVYKCVIYGDKNYYFVDNKNQIVSIDNYGEPYVVGYKVKSPDSGFDWIFSAQGFTYGVDSQGKMWSKTYAGDMFVVGRVYNIKQ